MQRAYTAVPFVRVSQRKRVPTTNWLSTFIMISSAFWSFVFLAEETSPYLLLGAQDQRLVRSKINCLVGPREPLLATVKRGKLAWFGRVTRHDSLSKTSFRASWIVGDDVVGRGNVGWTTWKSRHSCPCRNCSQGSPAGKKTEILFLLNRPLCPPEDPFDQGTELNWTAFGIFEFSIGWKC